MAEPEFDPRWRPTADLTRDLAGQFGTPLYVIDENHFRSRIRDYISAARKADPNCEITFASKANSVLAVLKIAHSEGCLIDVASEGELRAALAAGVPASACHMHGNNKSRAEIEFALSVGINQIVVDNFEEINTLAELRAATPLVLRLAPGVLPITNEKISTGQQDTKFGFSIQDGSAEKALVQALNSGLRVVGFHCHVGSQLLDPEAQISAGQRLAQFAAEMKSKRGFITQVINAGGGRAVRYTNESPIALADYCQQLAQGVRRALEGTDLNPKLVQEPGRSLIAESGVTIYTIGSIKFVESPDGGTKRYVIVNGGLADNPRPAMYDAKYAVEAIACDGRELGESSSATVSGRHCETDLLFDQVMLPNDLQPGDLLIVLTTGAYSSSMASNYNRYPRPATVLVRDSGPVIVQRAESYDEMLAREVLPEGI